MSNRSLEDSTTGWNRAFSAAAPYGAAKAAGAAAPYGAAKAAGAVALLACALCALVSCAQGKDEAAPLFEDDFASKSSCWDWRMDPNPDNPIVSQELTADGIRFGLTGDANASRYYNSEIYEANGATPWLHAAASFRLRNPELSAGSRGWGLWNGTMNQGDSQLAWFVRLQGDGGAMPEGFYAVTQIGDWVDSFQIAGVDLGAWHDYEIDWDPDRVVFRIDGAAIHTSDRSPTASMRLDVWVDNAVYNAEWRHVYQDPGPSSLELDRVRVEG